MLETIRIQTGAALRRPIVGTALLMMLGCAAQMSAQVVATYDFEDGTADGWTSFYGASTPTNTTAAAYHGTHSLLTTTGAGHGGPSIDLTSVLLPGATYTITGYVMLTPGEAATSADFTMKRTDSGCSGGTCYDPVGTHGIAVSASGWTQIGGTYTVSGTETDLTLYAELVGPTTPQSFYLDYVVITQTAGPPSGPQNNAGLSTDFEDGGLDGWTPRFNDCTLTNSTAQAYSGTHSLLVTNRTAAYVGPQISVSDVMYVGSNYSISVWVRTGPNATADDTLRVSLQTTYQGNTTYTTVVGNTAVKQNTWVNLSIPNFSMSYNYDPGQAFLYVESNSGTQDFYIDDFVLTYLPPLTIQTNIPSIFETLANYFPVGAEIDTTDLYGAHKQLLLKHFDSITSGNDMKWSSVEPTEGSFTYSTADSEVALAVANGMRVRGHNLVWATGQQTPSWVFLEEDGKTPLSASNPADVALLTSRIQNHIMNEVQHFGTNVYVWDVVNEPLDASQPDCLQHGPFYNVLGKSYIDIALNAARQYAPAGTQLFINDYSTADPPRLACLVGLVQDLRNRGIPLDGVGHETHVNINYPSVAAVVNSIQTVANDFPGIHQQITEMDVSVYKAGDNTSNYGANGGTVPASIIAEQGWLYEQYFVAFRQLKGLLDSVTFWGMADDDTWLDSFPIKRLDLPLPFDTQLQAKPAYWGIVDPTQLPGYGLEFTLSSKTGAQNARVWTVTATNPSSATAYGVQINGFTLTQVSGAACTPVVTPPSTYPVSLGDIAAGASSSAAFTINFTGCPALARFALSAPWSSAVYETGTFALGNQYR